MQAKLTPRATIEGSVRTGLQNSFKASSRTAKQCRIGKIKRKCPTIKYCMYSSGNYMVKPTVERRVIALVLRVSRPVCSVLVAGSIAR